jgi:pimeloyl-ACP methyl ester carboxylesterase
MPSPPTVFTTLIPVLGGADFRLAVKLWTPASSAHLNYCDHPRRALAYPGWLDNAGSFDTLAPILCEELELTICAIDPPGCGLSDHKPRSAVYSDFEEPPLVIEIANQLGWDSFVLIGHSRGGSICAWACALCPQRVIAFVCLESQMGLSGNWVKDMLPGAPTPPERMMNALNQLKKNVNRETRVFASVEEAVKANAESEFQKSPTTARNIVMRHLRPHPEGWTFTHDPKAYGQSQFLTVNQEHSNKFLSGIACPVLHVVRSENAWSKHPEVVREMHNQRMSMVKRRDLFVVPGDHHVHSDKPREVANVVVPWLKSKFTGSAPTRSRL